MQIYKNHQRMWLGTSNQEEDATRFYNKVAVKFRGEDIVRNFNLVETHPKALFLRGHSRDEIVDMLRRDSYDEELHKKIRSPPLPPVPTSRPPRC